MTDDKFFKVHDALETAEAAIKLAKQLLNGGDGEKVVNKTDAKALYGNAFLSLRKY